MSAPSPGFFRRLALAIGAFPRIIFNRRFAGAVLLARRGRKPTGEQVPRPPVKLHESQPDAALQLLGLLQQQGRFIDFVQEEVSKFSDAEVGAAARVVHEGCRKALREHLTIAPIRTENEGAGVTLEAGFDASAVRLTGNVVGQPPFNGRLVHRGWRSVEVTLPKVTEGHDVGILAPAEVEL